MSSSNFIMNGYSKILNVNIDNFDINDINKSYFNSFQFRTENSKDINIKLLKYAEKYIDRCHSIIQLLNITKDILISQEIEKGIFEFSLLHVTTHCLEHKMVPLVYKDKVFEIVHNLTDNKNPILLSSIINGTIISYAVAFLSPQQLNPSVWVDILNKKKFREDKENNMATTDRYVCSKCKERKAKVTELQIRGADEPTNLFITCLVCYNTFII